jgi:hypothetical protein
MRFKQRAITEFTVAEKASVTNIYKRIKMSNGVNGVDEGTVSRWTS